MPCYILFLIIMIVTLHLPPFSSQDAVLVNASRGAVVDEEALVAHMQKNPKFRAGLDVFEVKYEKSWEEMNIQSMDVYANQT